MYKYETPSENVKVSVFKNGEELSSWKATKDEQLASCLMGVKLYKADAIQLDDKIIKLSTMKRQSDLSIRNFLKEENENKMRVL